MSQPHHLPSAPAAAPAPSAGAAPTPAAATPRPPLQPADVRRAYRDSAEPILGGVASGLAHHLGWSVLWVRVAFVATSVLGLGVMMYAGLWLVLPTDRGLVQAAPGLESATRTGRRPGRVRRLGDAGPAIVLAVIAVGLVASVNAIFGLNALIWPLVLAGVGIALLWRQADEAQRERWLESGGRVDPVAAVFGRGGWSAYARVFVGAGLILAALFVFAATTGSAATATTALVAALLGIGGLALVVGPWFYRLATDLTDERSERIRTQERADVAAHLHDSVLQTLALIQKNADDAATVARLARSQERDLRAWLYAGESADESTLASALRGVGATIEDAHGVVVDVVAVGDCPFSEELRPIVNAAREAVTNAAKHAGTGRVDVYAEVTPEAVEVFVRDRGRGFDLDAVPEDRQGVRGSIVDRMARHGGRAEIRTSPEPDGGGTEVRLHLPRPHGRPDSAKEAR